MPASTRKALKIDGSTGEGGGQIIRTALSLSMLTGTPIEITNIRAGRAKPGLMRQHLMCVQASQQISNASVSG
ncbi:RNA 3'-terminal phosphate cyclase, partial [uncultured Psychrobacter sp.]